MPSSRRSFCSAARWGTRSPYAPPTRSPRLAAFPSRPDRDCSSSPVGTSRPSTHPIRRGRPRSSTRGACGCRRAGEWCRGRRSSAASPITATASRAFGASSARAMSSVQRSPVVRPPSASPVGARLRRASAHLLTTGHLGRSHPITELVARAEVVCGPQAVEEDLAVAEPTVGAETPLDALRTWGHVIAVSNL